MKQKLVKIKFSLGIPGFEAYQDWNFIPEEDAPLAQLIFRENEYIGFVLTRPESYFPTYLDEIEFDSDSRRVLEIQEDTKLEVWSILCMADDVMKTTINLKAPLVINLEKQVGYQLILNEEKYNSKELLFSQQDQKTREERVKG